MRIFAAMLLATFVSVVAYAYHLDPAMIYAAHEGAGLPELPADVFRLERVEKHWSEGYGTIPIWVFQFHYRSFRSLSFYGYSTKDGDFMSGYGDYARLDLGDTSSRRYYGYQIRTPSGWKTVDPWQFPFTAGFFIEPVTPRNFKVTPGVVNEIYFNLGHAAIDFPGRAEGHSAEIRVGLFCPEGNFWSEPFRFP